MKFYSVLVLSIAAVFLLAACGGAEPTPTPAPTPTTVPTPTQEPTAGLGTLEVRVTARPPDSVASALVTVQNIQVNLSRDSGETGWQTIDAGPRQFDLAKMGGIEEVLGRAKLEPGRYQQLRLEITEAVFTIFGNVRDAEVLADGLGFVGAFEVEAGTTTVLTLDVDAEGSLKFQPGIGPGLDPVVKLMVRKEGQPRAAAGVVAAVGEKAVSQPPPGPGPRPASGAIRVALPVDELLRGPGGGLFDDEGLDVQVVASPSPLATAQFMVMGQANVAVLPRPIYLDSVGRGEPVLTFANLFQNDPINLVVRKEVAAQRGLSAGMPLAERLKALRGLKVGVAPGSPTWLRVLFESVELDADSDIEMVLIHGDEQNSALTTGSPGRQ